VHHDDAASVDSHRYAGRLLADLEMEHLVAQTPPVHPALRWAQCGAMSLTGRRDGAPTMCPVPLASCADGALLALQALAGAADGVLPPGGELLAERAALSGFARNGRIAPGGACRLLDCTDGRIAVSLARAEDWAAVPAWVGAMSCSGAGPSFSEREVAWAAVASACAERRVDEVVERGRLLSLAVAADRVPGEPAATWLEIDCENPQATRGARERPLVVDFSSLWAGPLSTHLLALLGARVIKVESTSRPDGARAGHPAFYDLLNHGKASIAVDFRSSRDRDLLQRLLASADIVVEASRPRAFAQLGIDAADRCAAGRAVTWISLTGHGGRPPHGDWVAFGDDAAVAAGLSSILRNATGEPLICGDAIGDPLAGIHAALAAWWSHCRGGARRISLSLRGVTQYCTQIGGPLDESTLRERQHRWTALMCEAGVTPRAPPRRNAGSARAVGADTGAILRECARAHARAG